MLCHLQNIELKSIVISYRQYAIILSKKLAQQKQIYEIRNIIIKMSIENPMNSTKLTELYTKCVCKMIMHFDRRMHA